MYLANFDCTDNFLCNPTVLNLEANYSDARQWYLDTEVFKQKAEQRNNKDILVRGVVFIWTVQLAVDICGS